MLRFPVKSNAGIPSFGRLFQHSRRASRRVSVPSHIVHILRARRFTEIVPAVIQTVAVDVVDILWRPFPCLHRPDNAMRVESFPGHLYYDVGSSLAGATDASSRFPGVAASCGDQIDKNADFRLIFKSPTQFFNCWERCLMSMHGIGLLDRLCGSKVKRPHGVLALCGLAILALTACAPKPEAAPIVAAPYPTQYSCADLRQANAEFEALPAESMLAVLISDYGKVRRELRAVHGLSDQACPKPAS